MFILKELYYTSIVQINLHCQLCGRLELGQWVEPQSPGHLIHDTQFFSIESLRNIQTYHRVPLESTKKVQRGPFQGLLVFHHFFPKISYFTKQALALLFFGQPSSVIPFRKALAIPIAGPYWSLTWLPPPMRNKQLKIRNFHTVTHQLHPYQNFSLEKSSL